MTQFHEGQEVEVRKIADGMNEMHWSWRKAKVVHLYEHADGGRIEVQFPDGTRDVFDEGQIMAVDPHIYVTPPLEDLL